jgi:cytochrome c oxidase subunit I
MHDSFASLTSTQARRLGLLHLALTTVALGAGIVLALSLFTTEGPAHLAVMRAHGVLMMSVVLVPALPTVLGNLLLPQVLGAATGLAFPRLGWVGLLLHALAFVFFIAAAQTGGTGVGWELHMAYAREHVPASVGWLLLSLFAAYALPRCAS